MDCDAAGGVAAGSVASPSSTESSEVAEERERGRDGGGVGPAYPV